MINIKKIIRIALLGIAFVVSSTVGALSKATTYDDVAALETAVKSAKTTLDQAAEAYNKAKEEYDAIAKKKEEEQKKAAEERDASHKRNGETYDQAITDLEAKVNACETGCANLIEEP